MEANAKKFFSSVAISGLEAVTAKRRYLTKCEPKVMEIDDEEKIVKTACRACIANCGVLAHVKNGRVIKLEGNPVDPMSQGRMCAKGLAGIQALYHPNRNKYPLLRVGERGSGRWRRISWDEALTLVTDELKRVYAEYGQDAVVCNGWRWAPGSAMFPVIGGAVVIRKSGVSPVSVMYSERRTGMSRAARSVICRVCCPVP